MHNDFRYADLNLGDGGGMPPRFGGGGAFANRFGGGTPAAPAASAPASNPFAGLIPSTTQLQNFAPRPYTDFGGIPTITPTYMQPGQVGDTQMPGGMGLFESQLIAAMMPQFAAQRQGLDSEMASRGIFNSGAAQQASNDLSGQQAAAIANPLGALTQQGMGLYGEGVLQNAQLQQGANQYNAGAANTANATNAAAYGSIVGNDQANYNAFLQQLMQGGMGLTGTLLDSYLGSYGADPSVGGVLSQGLAGTSGAYSNALNAGQANAGNLANIFGNAGYAFGQGLKPHQPAMNAAGWMGFGNGVPSLGG